MNKGARPRLLRCLAPSAAAASLCSGRPLLARPFPSVRMLP